MRCGPVVLQYVAQVTSHDAISNESFAFHNIIRHRGWRSLITCYLVDWKLRDEVTSLRSRFLKQADLFIIHYGHASEAFEGIFSAKKKTVLVYHGITPARFFVGTNPRMVDASSRGSREISRWSELAGVAICHSNFAAADLREAGFERIIVLPYVLHEELYNVIPDPGVLKQFSEDGYTNLLTVGRVVPHKCIEDCIFVFDYFQRHVKPRSRLLIVGPWEGAEAYLQRLLRLVERLGTRDVIFTGAVSQAALLSYYKLAHAYLCMSEHEGFGVSLVEAMRYDVPVFAYKSSAIPETLGCAGLQFEKKDWPLLAEAVGAVLSDKEMREEVIHGQRERARFYDPDQARKRFNLILDSLLDAGC